MSEVILLERIAKLGNIGDIVNVKGGFARNYLIPNNKATVATKANIEYFKKQKAELEAKNAELLKKAQNLAATIGEKCSITLYKKIGDDGKLYGSVTAKEVVSALKNERNVEITPNCVKISHKIKEEGEFNLELQLHPDLSTKITLHIKKHSE